MATNERVTNRTADDGTLCWGRRELQNIWNRRVVLDICDRILFLLIMFSVSMTRSARKRDMVLHRVTYESKTNCGRGLITDPIVNVVTDGSKISRLAWNPLRGTYFWRLSPGVECCFRRIYSYSFGLHRYLIKKSDHSEASYWVRKQRSAFVFFANLLVFLSNDKCLRDYDLVVAHCWSSFQLGPT